MFLEYVLLRTRRLLIDPDDVTARIAKSCCYLGSITTDWLNYLTAVRDDRIDSFTNAVDHYVEQ